MRSIMRYVVKKDALSSLHKKPIDYSNDKNFVKLNDDNTKTLYPKSSYREITDNEDQLEYVIHGNEIFLGTDNEYGLTRKRVVAKVYSGFSFEPIRGIYGGFKVVPRKY